MSRLPPRQGRDYRELARRLRVARLDADLLQERVAELIGKPQSFVSRLESGERRIDIVETAHLAKLYGKPLTYFDVTDGAEIPPPHEPGIAGDE